MPLARQLLAVALVCAMQPWGSGAQTFAPGTHDCPEGAWAAEQTVERSFPRGAHLDFVTATAAGGTVAYSGMLLRLVAGDPETDSSAILDRLDGVPAGLPPMSRSAAYPKVAASSDGSLHLVWGETAGSSAGKPRDDNWVALTTSLWYSRLTPGAEWSRPVELVRDSIGLWWYAGAGSLMVTDRGDAHVVLGDRRIRPGHAIHVVVPVDGAPRVTRIPFTYMASAYPAILVRGDTVLVVSAGVTASDREHMRAFLLRSADGGRSWDGPAGGLPWEVPHATTANLERGGDGQVHLVLGQAAPGSMWTERFHHFRSPDGGRTWHAEGRMQVPVAVQEPGLASDECGRLHLVFRDSDASGTRILYTRWNREGWSGTTRLFPDRGARSAVLLREPSDVYLLFHYAQDGRTGLMKARLATE